MKLFAKRDERRFPDVSSHAGCAHVPCGEDLSRDETLGVQLAAPEPPDFDALARELVASAGTCPSFHQSGIGQYPGKLARGFEAYACEVDEAAYRLALELDTTYRSSLASAIRVCENRLAQISGPPASRGKAKEKKGRAALPLEGGHHEP